MFRSRRYFLACQDFNYMIPSCALHNHEYSSTILGKLVSKRWLCCWLSLATPNATESRLGSPSTDSICFGNQIFLGGKDGTPSDRSSISLDWALWTHWQSTICSVSEINAKGPLFCKDPRMTRKPNAGFAKTGSQARTTILIYGGFDLIGSSWVGLDWVGMDWIGLLDRKKDR